MSSITWVIQNDKYVVSSKDHLLQLMHKGTYLSDTGDFPTDYWSSDYTQTSDIDLETDAGITPIGDSTENFTGTYDGAGFSITDWGYQTTVSDNTGMFGYISSSLVENINLEGTWTLSGTSNCGFIVGTMVNGSGVYNITGDFSSGSVTGTGGNIGTLVGSATGCTLEGLTTKGVLDSISSSTNTGGIVGLVSTTDMNYIRNMTRYTETSSMSAISGDVCGGVCGLVTSCNITYVTNAMIGSISGVTHAGGIFGSVTNTSAYIIDRVVNSMTGNITSSTGNTGGISSHLENTSMVNTANYMNGSITAISGSSGGISGVGSSISILNSVVSMKGTVVSTGVDSLTGTGNVIELRVDTGFGLSYTSDSSTTTLTSLNLPFYQNDSINGLELFDMEGTDTLSNVYDWEFVFANVSGSIGYSQYTHIVVSSGDITGPVEVQTDLDDNTVAYVYFMDYVSGEVRASPGISILYSSGTVTDTGGLMLYPIPPLVLTATSPFSVVLSWTPVENTTTYRVDYSVGSSVVGSPSMEKTHENSYTLYNLEASVEYSFKIYSSEDGIIFNEIEDVIGTVIMPDNIGSSYLISRFLYDGIYDFSGFSPDKASKLAVIIPTILGQDESVKMKLNGETRELLVAGVSGGTVDTTDGDQYILPFQTTEGTGQSITFEGIYEGTVNYNETNESLTIGGVEYFSGDSVVLGDVRMTLGTV